MPYSARRTSHYCIVRTEVFRLTTIINHLIYGPHDQSKQNTFELTPGATLHKFRMLVPDIQVSLYDTAELVDVAPSTTLRLNRSRKYVPNATSMQMRRHERHVWKT